MRLGVVTPSLDEESALSETLASARRTMELTDLLIVSDGGSTDRSLEIAAAAGAVIVTGDSGRGPQLNRGARAAIERGATCLLFLHADTVLSEHSRAAIEQAVATGVAGGGFAMRFDLSSTKLRLAALLINARTRMLRLPLGDQAQFATTAAFEAAGGFPEWPILEDLELIRRLRRLGPLAVLTPPVRTAARRFVQRGALRTVSTNWLIWSLFALGVGPERLGRLYRKVR